MDRTSASNGNSEPGRGVRIIRFGAFEFQPETGELRKSGVRVRLQGRAFQILQALLEHPGEVVTREELKTRLWPSDTFVDFESGLNTAANRLRLTLGDSAENPRFIETVARTGYRFISPVTYHETSATQSAASPGVASQPAAPVRRDYRPYWIAALLLVALAGSAGLWLTRKPPSKPVFRQVTFRRGLVSGARFGPDGQSIIYSARWDSSPSQLFLANTFSPESRSLDFSGTKLGSVSSTSELALISLNPQPIGGSFVLSRVPLNGGAPLTVATGVSGADWAPDGRSLAIYRTRNTESVIEYPIGKVLLRSAGYFSDLRISPQGDRLAFIEHPLRQDDAGMVRIIEKDGTVHSVTPDWASAGGLAWSPSGSEVWFTAGTTGLRRTLYAVTVDGRLRQVATLPDRLTLFDISKTGRVLLGIDRGRMMIGASLPGKTRQTDLSLFDWSGAVELSADGGVLLFDETGEGGGPNHGVYLRNIVSGSTVRLGDGQALALSPDLQWAVAINRKDPGKLSILPNGPESARSLSGNGLSYSRAQFFRDGRRLLVAGSYPNKPLGLFVQSLDGGDPAPVAHGAFLGGALLSPDCQRIAGWDADHKLAVLSLAGGSPQPLNIPFNAAVVGWSDDGKSLFVRDLDNFLPLRIFRYDIAASRLRVWREVGPEDQAGLAYFLNVVVSRDERTCAYTYLRVLSELFAVDGWS